MNYKFYGQPQGCSGMVVLIVGIVCLLLMGCKHIEYVSVPEMHTDTLYVSKVQHDSIHVKDSVYIHEWMKGDTVFLEVLKTKTKTKIKLLTDTIRESRVDSVAVPYPVEVVKTEHHWGGWIAFIVTIVAIGAIAIKRMRN